MKRVLLSVVFLGVLLLLFAGCQSDSMISTNSSDPAATEQTLTMQSIKTHITQGITYAEVRDIFGVGDKDIGSPINNPIRVWCLKEDGDADVYLEISFQYPDDPYYLFEDWCASLNLPAELTPESADYYYYLGVWFETLQANNAMLRKDGQTIEVLFGEDYYASSPTDPTETERPRTVEYFKSHLKPYMTYGEMKKLFGSSDNYLGGADHIATRVWCLEDDYMVVVTCFPTANEYTHEYLATQPTGEDGTPCDELYYFLEWKNHMQAYNATLYKSTLSEKNIIEVWFDCGGNPWRQ